MKCSKQLCLFALILAILVPMARAAAPDTGTTPMKVTVRVTGRNRQAPPKISINDILVFQNSQRRQAIDLTPVTEISNGVDLAILIDSSIGRTIALQYPDIKTFVQALPDTTNVGVAYAEYGSARFAQKFTTDHGLVDNALRLPEGRVDAGGSVYQSVGDLAKRWPADGRVRVALLISDGVDVNRGLSETDPTMNPDLADAIRQSQAAGVTIYAIFAGSSARIEHRSDLNLNGQGSLTRLASETAGVAYFEGTHTPVAYKPFLDELMANLKGQYVLTFDAELRGGAHNAALRVSTELPHVKIAAPSAIRVPAAH